MAVPEINRSKASWAEEVEDIDGELPSPTTSAPDADGVITMTEWKLDEQGRKQKITRRIRSRTVVTQVNTSCALRKQWKKFGAAANDAPGPDLGTTSIGEEVFLKLSTRQSSGASATTGAGASSTKTSTSDDESAATDDKKTSGAKKVLCRTCKGDHWTLRCPYKDTLQPLARLTLEKDNAANAASSAAGDISGAKSASDKYIPPSKRGLGVNLTGGTNLTQDAYTIRITNISEEAKERDIHDLFRRFGHISRVFVAKDRVTYLSKGFAFINYETKRAAEEAITAMNGYGFHNLILSVEWAKPLEKD